MTGTIVAPVGSWSCVSHHQSPMFISLEIWSPSESVRFTGSKPRCTWNGRYTKRNWTHLKISLQYIVPMICESCSILLSSPSPKLSSERSFCRVSADWNDSILKLPSPHLQCWSIQVFVCGLNYWACWKLCADRNGCHGFHCSEYFQCMLYNPVALPYAFPSTFSTPATRLCALVLVRSSVQLGSGSGGTIASSLGVSSGCGGAPSMVSVSRSLIGSLSMAIQVPLL